MATEQQIPKLAGSLVEHQGGFSALSTEDTQFVIAETKKAIALFVEAVQNRAKDRTNKLLEFVTSVTVPGVSKFVAAEKFKHGEAVDGVKCYLWDNFQKHFGSKVEENVEGCDIRVHTLLSPARDLPILAEIGEEREETKLVHLWSMLKLQSEGQTGALVTNGYANVFYIRDIEGILWAVFASWSGDEWSLSARSVEDPCRWGVGSRVCSR